MRSSTPHTSDSEGADMHAAVRDVEHNNVALGRVVTTHRRARTCAHTPTQRHALVARVVEHHEQPRQERQMSARFGGRYSRQQRRDCVEYTDGQHASVQITTVTRAHISHLSLDARSARSRVNTNGMSSRTNGTASLARVACGARRDSSVSSRRAN
jgi:hypothetical protein